MEILYRRMPKSAIRNPVLATVKAAGLASPLS